MWSRSSCVLLVAAAQAVALDRYEAAETHMGTLFRLVVYASGPAEARDAFVAAFARAAEIDARLSDYKPDSELNRLCRSGRAVVSEDLFGVLETALAVSRASGGAFDVTVAPAARLWRGRIPEESEIRAARRLTGWRRIRLDPAAREVSLGKRGMQLDFGGIAKGYAADEMLAVLRGKGFASAMAAAGGDIVVGGAPPGRAGWTIGLPEGTVTVANSAVSTSGDLEQFVMDQQGRRHSHIVDPRTGRGLTNRALVSVEAPRGILADAWATALCVDPGLARGLPAGVVARYLRTQ